MWKRHVQQAIKNVTKVTILWVKLGICPRGDIFHPLTVDDDEWASSNFDGRMGMDIGFRA